MPLGTEVDLSPDHIVLDGDPVLARKKDTAAPLLSSPVYCGHGRPSQQLLSPCLSYHVCRMQRNISEMQWTKCMKFLQLMKIFTLNCGVQKPAIVLGPLIQETPKIEKLHI